MKNRKRLTTEAQDKLIREACESSQDMIDAIINWSVDFYDGGYACGRRLAFEDMAIIGGGIVVSAIVTAVVSKLIAKKKDTE